MARTFLLLEIVDPEVSAFLWRMRSIIAGRRVSGAIHVTLRGPYEGDVPTDNIKGWQAFIRHDVLKIAGVGRFLNGLERVVFFRVDSPHLRSVWWKPSFPIERFGFEPHISVYRGPDDEYAEFIARVLRRERIELLCAEHRLVWHRVGQPDLFRRQSPTIASMERLLNSGRVDVSALDRVEDAIGRYRSGHREESVGKGRTRFGG
jgi:hypothetical protein